MSGSLVPFVTTPANLRIPLMSFEIGATDGGGQEVQRTLLIGYSQTTLPLALILVSSLSQITAIVGEQSMLGRMVTAYLANDPTQEVWVLPVAPNAGDVDTQWTMAAAGTATSTGLIGFYAGGQRLAVSVNVGDTAQAIITEFQAATVPFTENTAKSASGVNGTATAANFLVSMYRFSAAGESVDVRFNLGGARAGESVPEGIALTLTKTVVGVGTPNLSGVAAALGQKNFDFIFSGFIDSVSLGQMQLLLNDVGGRWSPNSMEMGHVWTSVRGTAVDVQALGAIGGGENDRHTTMIGCVSPTSPWELGAAVLGSCATSLRNNPTTPLQSLAVIGPVAPPDAEALSRPNQQYLLTNGIAVVRWDYAGNCFVERMITTYQDDANGNPDETYLDTETLYQTMLFVRTMQTQVSATFARVGLADNGTHFGAGVPIATPNDIRNEMVAVHKEMELTGLVEDTDGFAASLVVVRNTIDASRVDVLMDPTYVSGLRILANLVRPQLLSAATLAAA